MIVAIDIGNSDLKVGLFRGEKPVGDFRLQHREGLEVDDYQRLFTDWLSQSGVYKEDIDRIIVGSVFPTMTEAVCTASSVAMGKWPLIATTDLRLNVSILPENRQEIGIDLVANAAALYARFGAPCIAVDLGTALTLTAVDADGVLIGVAIAPGLRTAVQSLSIETALLPTVPLRFPPGYLGRNTVHAMQAGIMYGFCGLVERLLNGMRSELRTAAPAIATGGLSSTIIDQIRGIDEIDPLLTLRGLRLIAALNE